jgi:hypothetical protein
VISGKPWNVNGNGYSNGNSNDNRLELLQHPADRSVRIQAT